MNGDIPGSAVIYDGLSSCLKDVVLRHGGWAPKLRVFSLGRPEPHGQDGLREELGLKF